MGWAREEGGDGGGGEVGLGWGGVLCTLGVFFKAVQT